MSDVQKSENTNFRFTRFTRFTNKNLYNVNVMSDIILPRRGYKIQIQNPNKSSSVVFLI